MTKKKLEPISSPGPTAAPARTYPEMRAVMEGKTNFYNATPNSRIPQRDWPLVHEAAKAHLAVDPGCPLKQSLTLACGIYWALYDEQAAT